MGSRSLHGTARCEECGRQFEKRNPVHAICRPCAVLFPNPYRNGTDEWTQRRSIETQLRANALAREAEQLLANLSRLPGRRCSPTEPFDGWVYLQTLMHAVAIHDLSELING